MSYLARIKKKLYFVAAWYFRIFANLALRRWHPRIIAITGSAGKTTMLHLCEAEFGERGHYSHFANSAFGVAFDLVGIRGITGSKWRWLYLIFAVPIRSLYYRRQGEFYFVEIDGERPHEAEFLAKWLQPEVTLWVSLGRSHAVQFEKVVAAGQFESLEAAITHEFAQLPRHTTGTVYLDANNPQMMQVARELRQQRRVATGQMAPQVSQRVNRQEGQMAPQVSQRVNRQEGQTAPRVVAVDAVGQLKRYAVYPSRTDFVFPGATFHFAQPQPREIALQLLMLEKLCRELGVKLKTDLSKMPVPPGRSSYFEGIRGVKLVDSSYNAHLISMASILNMAREMKAGHKWLVIGDIVDEGQIEAEEHRKLAGLIAQVKPEMVILVGRRTKKYTAPELRRLGVPVRTTVDPKKALAYIKGHITGEETLIFKGSQYLEWIIEKLLKNPDDARYLPRREAGAVRRRQKWGLDA